MVWYIKSKYSSNKPIEGNSLSWGLVTLLYSKSRLRTSDLFKKLTFESSETSRSNHQKL
jgi:hypothetical protein